MKRLFVLGLALVLLFVLASVAGVRDALTVDRLQLTVAEAGWWGVGLFFLAFTVGQLLQVPGAVFIVVGRAAWGPVLGFANGYVGAVLSASLVFLFVRAVGGKPLGDVTWPPARRLLGGLERWPVLTVAALRAVMMLNPPLNYALALSPVQQRHHLLGSMLGLVVPVAVVAFFSEGLLAALS